MKLRWFSLGVAVSFATLSVAFLLSVASWWPVEIHWIFNDMRRSNPVSKDLTLIIQGGGFGFVWKRVDALSSGIPFPVPELTMTFDSRYQTVWQYPDQFRPGVLWYLGFQWRHISWYTAKAIYTEGHLAFPFWFVALPAIPLPWIWVRRSLRRVREARVELCPASGYYQRGSPRDGASP